MKIHHVGIACRNIEETLIFIEKTYKVIEKTCTVYDPLQDVNLCFITVEDNLNIELVSGSKVENLIKKNINLYHLCYEVDDIDKSIKSFIDGGSFLISKPKSAVLFNGRKVCFLTSPLGIIELLEAY